MVPYEADEPDGPGADNFRDPSYGSLYLNFDGTIRSGLGDPRQVQAGLRWLL